MPQSAQLDGFVESLNALIDQERRKPQDDRLTVSEVVGALTVVTAQIVADEIRDSREDA